MNPGDIFCDLESSIEMDAEVAQMTPTQVDEQLRLRRIPGLFFTTPNFSYFRIAPQQHGARSTTDTFISTWTPRSSANYADRLTCVLLNHLQGDIQPHLPWSNGGIFNPPDPKRRQVYAAQIGKYQQLWLNTGLISMLSLHYVQISIDISKVRQGKNYLYEIVARGTCHDEEGEVLHENGKLLEVYMCVSWMMTSSSIPNPKNSTETMSWHDLLRFLRRYAKVHYNEYGETRNQEDAEIRDGELGYALHWANCVYIGDYERNTGTWMEQSVADHDDKDIEAEDDDNY